MGDKSPRQSTSKKSDKTLKQKRAERKAKGAADSGGSEITDISRAKKR